MCRYFPLSRKWLTTSVLWYIIKYCCDILSWHNIMTMMMARHDTDSMVSRLVIHYLKSTKYGFSNTEHLLLLLLWLSTLSKSHIYSNLLAMSRFKFLWCGLPCRKRPQTSEIQEDQSITNVTDQNPPQIQIASLEGPRLATHTPAISDPLSVYSWYSAHSRIQKRPYERLPLDVELEEETNPGYRAETWYHVRIGEIVRDRYLICTKLGWGDTSTVWLANDLRYVHSRCLSPAANITGN